MRTISLRTQPGCPEENFGAHNLEALWGGRRLGQRSTPFSLFPIKPHRDVNAASLSSSVRSLSLPPIPQVRTPASLGAVFGGQTGALGGVAVAPDGSNISPVALNLLNAKNPDGTYVIPSPQTSGSGVNYTAVVPGHYNEDQFNTNFDFNLRLADRLSAKFFFSNSNQDVPFFAATVPGFPALRSFENRNLAIAETHIFSSRATNQFRFGFSRLCGTKRRRRDAHRSGRGDKPLQRPPGGDIPHIDVLGAFGIGQLALTTGAKRPVITFTFPTSYSCLGASTIFASARKSSEISLTI